MAENFNPIIMETKKKEIKCKDCNQPMVFVHDIGGTVQEVDASMAITGIRSLRLYQCPEDKTIAVN